MPRPTLAVSLAACLFVMFLIGCGSGSGSTPPVAPTFTSVPVTAADEGAPYTYKLVATSPDGGSVTFALTQSPDGATLSGDTINWTPSHTESRTGNAFSVTARSASGGSATQSWTVTPTGVVTITAVLTYWTPTGTIDKPRVFLADLPYPAALIPQSDGSLTRLQGATNPDSTVSIRLVPAGYYWLQLSPAQNFWTSSSTFDAGQDIAGNPPKTTTLTTTTINVNLTGADPIQLGDLFTTSSDVIGIPLPVFAGGPVGGTSINFSVPLNTNEDFSQIHTLFFNQYEPVTSGSFIGSAIGTSLTQSNVTITNGTSNTVGGALAVAPKTSVPLSIKGSLWAASLENVAPVTPTPFLTDYSVSVQPFVQNRFASPLFVSLIPQFLLLAPSLQSATTFSLGGLVGNFCGRSSGPDVFPFGNFGLAPILTDQDFGTVPYGDPFPSAWIREFQYCQHATVDLPRPNSNVTDSFLLTSGETIALPAAPIAPLVGPVQLPTLNGASIFQSATLNTTTLKLAWSAPSGSTPAGYYVTSYILAPTLTGAIGYVPAGRFATAKNSMTIPFITAGNTYVFLITASVNAGANIETSPFRSQLPLAHSTVLSAPIIINPGATANLARSPL